MKKLLLFLLIVPFSLSAQNFWTEVALFENPGFYARQISIVNTDVIWVWGQDSFGNDYSHRYSISLDGGVTWSDGIINSNLSTTVTSMHAVSASTAYVTVAENQTGGSSGVWKTTNSGATWTSMALNSNGSFWPNFIHFFDENKGVVVSDPQSDNFQIYTTADAGLHWNLIPSTNLPALIDGEYGYSLEYRTKAGTIWFGTNKGRIFKSTDMGQNWSVRQSPLSDFSASDENGSYDFKNDTEGLLISNDFNFYRTTDAGTTWTQESASDFRNFEMVFVNGTANTYFSLGEESEGFERGSSYSTDGGSTWINLNEVDADPVMPTTAKFASGTVGFCIGTYLSESPTAPLRFFRLTDPLNRFLKTDDFDSVKFSATPNPTAGAVKISGANINSVVICDISGKIITAQNYGAIAEAELDLTSYQSGIYFAKTTDENGASSTVKIIKN